MKMGYSVRDLAEQGICGKTKAYELIAEGKLKTIKLGRKTIITGDSVRALLEAA
jgi:excisionase family DNA binding protein